MTPVTLWHRVAIMTTAPTPNPLLPWAPPKQNLGWQTLPRTDVSISAVSEVGVPRTLPRSWFSVPRQEIDCQRGTEASVECAEHGPGACVLQLPADYGDGVCIWVPTNAT